MKYYKPNLMYITYMTKGYKELDNHIYFLWNNCIEKAQPHYSGEKSSLMKTIEKKFFNCYVYLARYQDVENFCNIINLKGIK